MSNHTNKAINAIADSLIAQILSPEPNLEAMRAMTYKVWKDVSSSNDPVVMNLEEISDDLTIDEAFLPYIEKLEVGGTTGWNNQGDKMIVERLS